MKTVKNIIAFTAALALAASSSVQLYADEPIIEIIPETGDTNINVYPDKERHEISPYIYGINDKGDISGISPTVIKHTGSELSTYNWENNYSNPGTDGMNTNDVSLVDSYPSSKWNVPALHTDYLYTRSTSNDIPVRLVTLQMMGFAARDSMGIVTQDELSKNTRWCKVRFNKNDTFLNQPDTEDDVVYMDEYVSYLVNRYGTASSGGINGYFLDSEPDLWDDKFSVLEIPKITPEELVNRSALLADAVKTIDGQAFVFGPSVSGLQGCINLNNSAAWSSRSLTDNEYSWFIDYYLSEMRKKGDELGYRLLDVLDIHYYTEAITPISVPILTNDDDYSNAYRMQAVKTLWDPDYTENSATVLMNKQFTPVIPTLQASIRINYPGTRLSFSEYDFGGGNNMSGAIAQTDVLGTFASENVYLACLSPTSEDYSFQKAAINLYTDYDGLGTDFGDMFIQADNESDSMSSVFAASDSETPENLRIILTNKNIFTEKNFNITIHSDEYEYELTEAYTIDSETADIISADIEMFDLNDDIISFSADSMSVYMLVLEGKNNKTDKTVDTDVWQTMASESEISNAEETAESSVITEQTTTVTESIISDTTTVNQPDVTVPDFTDDTEAVTAATEPPISETTVTETETSLSETVIPSDVDTDRTVAAPIKIIVTVLAVTVAAGVVYILIFDRR